MPFNTQEFVAGFLSGMVNVSVGHPLDTIKVLYQTNSPLPRSILPYYRGFAVPLGLVPVENAIVFGVYHKSRPYFEKDAIYGHALAGGLAGLAYALFASPMELAKIRLQTRKADESAGAALHGIWRDRALGKGMGITLQRDMFAFAAQFSTYEVAKKELEKRRGESTLNFAFAGALSGIACWLASYPQDVVKTRIQREGGGGKTFAVAAEIYKERGMWGFWRGVQFSLGRVAIVDAAAFSMFELTNKWFKEKE